VSSLQPDPVSFGPPRACKAACVRGGRLDGGVTPAAVRVVLVEFGPACEGLFQFSASSRRVLAMMRGGGCGVRRAVQ